MIAASWCWPTAPMSRATSRSPSSHSASTSTPPTSTSGRGRLAAPACCGRHPSTTPCSIRRSSRGASTTGWRPSSTSSAPATRALTSSAPYAVELLRAEGLDHLYAYNHELAWWAGQHLTERWGTMFATPEAMIGAMVTVALPESLGASAADAETVRVALDAQQIEAPIYPGPDRLSTTRVGADLLRPRRHRAVRRRRRQRSPGAERDRRRTDHRPAGGSPPHRSRCDVLGRSGRGLRARPCRRVPRRARHDRVGPDRGAALRPLHPREPAGRRRSDRTRCRCCARPSCTCRRATAPAVGRRGRDPVPQRRGLPRPARRP